jgi:hypothetical protein
MLPNIRGVYDSSIPFFMKQRPKFNPANSNPIPAAEIQRRCRRAVDLCNAASERIERAIKNLDHKA